MDALPVMEAFYTVQGEGFHQGKAAVFIRLAGCDVGCHWCDVKESWDANESPVMSVREIVRQVRHCESDIAVVTGGEPLMYDLEPLTRELKSAGFRTHIETSGAHNISGDWDWICFSPKKFKPPLAPIYHLADELKIIIYNNSDFKWAESYKEQVKAACKLYLQPEWGRSDKVLPLMIDYVKRHPEWEVSLQIHKFMDIP
jgi:organic radical activating enzyme